MSSICHVLVKKWKKEILRGIKINTTILFSLGSYRDMIHFLRRWEMAERATLLYAVALRSNILSKSQNKSVRVVLEQLIIHKKLLCLRTF